MRGGWTCQLISLVSPPHSFHLITFLSPLKPSLHLTLQLLIHFFLQSPSLIPLCKTISLQLTPSSQSLPPIYLAWPIQTPTILAVHHFTSSHNSPHTHSSLSSNCTSHSTQPTLHLFIKADHPLFGFS